MRFVFVGAGNLTVQTASLLIERGHEVVIIEASEERIDALSDELDCSFLLGDGSKPQILEEAGPSQSHVLFALSDNDQDNIIAALVARSLGFERVVPRISDPRFQYLCKELELEDSVVPDQTISRYLADMAEGVDVLNLTTTIKGNARLFSWTVTEKFAGPIRDLDIPETAKIICLYRKEEFQVVSADTELKKGDEAVFITQRSDLDSLKELLEPEQDSD